MQTGSRRFSRRLGAFPGRLGAEAPWYTQVTGIDVQRRQEGSGVAVVVSPSTIAFVMLGGGVGAAIQSASDRGGWFRGFMYGSIGALFVGQGMKFAGAQGF